MRIALVTPYSWTAPGGVNMHVRELGHHLRARGHEVRVLAPSDGPVEPGVISLGRTVGVPFNRGVARIAFGPRIAARVRTALRRARPDVIHIHEPLAPSASLLAALLGRAPTVVTFHSGVDAPALRVARAALRPLRGRFAVAIAVSDYAREIIADWFGPGVVVIPNGIETSLYNAIEPPEPTGRTVLFFGRLEERKGPQVLVAALPRLFDQIPDARIVIAGDGALRADLERDIPPALADRVTFPGAFGTPERVSLLRAANVVCLPARGESFGYTLVEAMAAGRAVVASDDPGYRCVATDGAEALLRDPDDPAAFADALAGLLLDPPAARAMGDRGRASAARYDWAQVTDQVERAYRTALGGGASESTPA